MMSESFGSGITLLVASLQHLLRDQQSHSRIYSEAKKHSGLSGKRGRRHG